MAGRGARPQQVIVHSGDLAAILDELEHDRIDLGFEQHQIAHDHDPAMHGLERGPAAERERRADGDAVERDVEIGARKRITVHVPGYGGSVSADGFIDLFPVDLLGVGCASDARQRTKCKHVNTTHR